MTTLTFQNHTLEIQTCKNGEWIRVSQIGLSLGYKNPDISLTRIYNRNKSEFTDSMVCKLRVKTNGGTQEVLAFSLRGAHLLAMFSRTPVAKEFRKWVLDVLEEKSSSPALTESQRDYLTSQEKERVLEHDMLMRVLTRMEENTKRPQLPHEMVQAIKLANGYSLQLAQALREVERIRSNLHVQLDMCLRHANPSASPRQRALI